MTPQNPVSPFSSKVIAEERMEENLEEAVSVNSDGETRAEVDKIIRQTEMDAEEES